MSENDPWEGWGSTEDIGSGSIWDSFSSDSSGSSGDSSDGWSSIENNSFDNMSFDSSSVENSVVHATVTESNGYPVLDFNNIEASKLLTKAKRVRTLGVIELVDDMARQLPNEVQGRSIKNNIIDMLKRNIGRRYNDEKYVNVKLTDGTIRRSSIKSMMKNMFGENGKPLKASKLRVNKKYRVYLRNNDNLVAILMLPKTAKHAVAYGEKIAHPGQSLVLGLDNDENIMDNDIHVISNKLIKKEYIIIKYPSWHKLFNTGSKDKGASNNMEDSFESAFESNFGNKNLSNEMNSDDDFWKEEQHDSFKQSADDFDDFDVIDNDVYSINNDVYSINNDDIDDTIESDVPDMSDSRNDVEANKSVNKDTKTTLIARRVDISGTTTHYKASYYNGVTTKIKWLDVATVMNLAEKGKVSNATCVNNENGTVFLRGIGCELKNLPVE